MSFLSWLGHSPLNLVGAFCERPYGVVRFSAYSVGERLGAPVFGAEGFREEQAPPLRQGRSVRITERSGVTLVPKTDSRGRLSLQLS